MQRLQWSFHLTVENSAAVDLQNFDLKEIRSLGPGQCVKP